MSFSFQLPEEDLVCECKYDEIRDRMDREDCPFHGDILEGDPTEILRTDRKPPASAPSKERVQQVVSGVADRKNRLPG